METVMETPYNGNVGKCPSCGYCPTCGRPGNSWPSYPWYPVYWGNTVNSPHVSWTDGTTTQPSTTTTTGQTAS